MIAGARPALVEHKAAGSSLASQVVTDIDRRSEAIIVDHLAPSCDELGLGLLTEERRDDGSRLRADFFWCIDPLDGTLPFVEGVAGYAVSVALVARDGTPVIGVVHDPVESVLLSAVAGRGAFRNDERWPSVSRPSRTTLAVFADRSFLSMPNHDEVMAGLASVARADGLDGVEVDATAGAVINACSVLANPPACYLKFPAASGGGSVWDFAATACIAAEVGATATDIHGVPLDLNRPDSTFMNHRGVLFATDDALAGRLRSIAREP